MKTAIAAMMAFVATGAVAQSTPEISPELLGTWASSEIDCKRVGPTTVTVTSSTVTRSNVEGSIQASRIIGRRSVEVVFDRQSVGAHALRFRRFVLSTDGKELFEYDGETVVEKRRRCETTST